MVDPQKQQYEQKRLKYNVTQVQPPQTWQGECYGICLLYTSDAADE